MIIIPAIQLFFFTFSEFLTFSRHSSSIPFGIKFKTKEIPSGISMMSSKYPKTGMKSGIKSIGLRAYPIINNAISFTYQDTLGCL